MPLTSLDLEDGVSTASANAVVTVGTSAVELKAGASALSGRIAILIKSLDNTIYLGSSNAVTTATGFPLDKGEIATFAANNAIWAIASNNNRKVAVFEFSSEQPI